METEMRQIREFGERETIFKMNYIENSNHSEILEIARRERFTHIGNNSLSSDTEQHGVDHIVMETVSTRNASMSLGLTSIMIITYIRGDRKSIEL